MISRDWWCDVFLQAGGTFDLVVDSSSFNTDAELPVCAVVPSALIIYFLSGTDLF